MIELTNLTKRFGDFTAVNDVTLTARPGEIFGFLGANGAGKTTTIRILAGLSLPSGGSARIQGHDVVTDSAGAKSVTGYVPDRPYLYEKLTGRELLDFVTDLYRHDRKSAQLRADRFLHYFDLFRWVDSRIESYSHGMKQKLVIIAALVHDPAVLIIDEPMVGLDALAQRQTRDLLREEASRGKTVFLTTHTLSVAESLCDRIAILREGRIAVMGTTDEVKARARVPGSPLEDAFLEISYGDYSPS
ncbi:MAG TPA: ABC transporter ATP-binding protein [Thermoanaerobaculia bacterium]|nr:ABC transporter ATP-binding protein [Thermoanaerobaculia bacterium]